MIHYTTPLHKVDVEDLFNLSDLTLMFCMATFGENNRKPNHVGLSFEFTHEDGDSFGEYDGPKHKITVFLNYTKTVKDLVNTIVHEYIHSLQPITSNYDRMLKEYKYYSKHPYERQAVYHEIMYSEKIFKLLSPLL